MSSKVIDTTMKARARALLEKHFDSPQNLFGVRISVGQGKIGKFADVLLAMGRFYIIIFEKKTGKQIAAEHLYELVSLVLDDDKMCSVAFPQQKMSIVFSDKNGCEEFRAKLFVAYRKATTVFPPQYVVNFDTAKLPKVSSSRLVADYPMTLCYEAFCAMYKVAVHDDVVFYFKLLDKRPHQRTFDLSKPLEYRGKGGKEKGKKKSEKDDKNHVPINVKPISAVLKYYQRFTCFRVRKWPETNLLSQMKSIVSGNPQILHLELYDCQLKPADVEQLGEALTSCTQTKNLESLVLSRNPLGDKGFNMIPAIAAKLPSLKRLRLAYCDATHSGIEALLHLLPKNENHKEFTTLDIMGNKLSVSGLNSRHTLLTKWITFFNATPKMKTLNCAKTWLTVETAYTLIDAFKKAMVRRIRKLDISYIKLDSTGCADLVRAVREMPSLRNLNVSHTNVDGVTVASVSKLMLQAAIRGSNPSKTQVGEGCKLPKKQFVSLYCDGNRLGTDKIEAIKTSLKSGYGEHIRRLHFQDNGLKVLGVQAILNTVKGSRAVEELNFGGNVGKDLTLPTCEEMGKSIIGLAGLRSLCLCGDDKNYFGENMIGLIEKLGDTSLECLDISKNRAGLKSLKALAEVIRTSRTLIEVNWDGNGCDVATYVELANAVIESKLIAVVFPEKDMIAMQKTGNKKKNEKLVKATKSISKVTSRNRRKHYHVRPVRPMDYDLTSASDWSYETDGLASEEEEMETPKPVKKEKEKGKKKKVDVPTEIVASDDELDAMFKKTPIPKSKSTGPLSEEVKEVPRTDGKVKVQITVTAPVLPFVEGVKLPITASPMTPCDDEGDESEEFDPDEADLPDVPEAASVDEDPEVERLRRMVLEEMGNDGDESSGTEDEIESSYVGFDPKTRRFVDVSGSESDDSSRHSVLSSMSHHSAGWDPFAGSGGEAESPAVPDQGANLAKKISFGFGSSGESDSEGEEEAALLALLEQKRREAKAEEERQANLKVAREAKMRKQKMDAIPARLVEESPGTSPRVSLVAQGGRQRSPSQEEARSQKIQQFVVAFGVDRGEAEQILKQEEEEIAKRAQEGRTKKVKKDVAREMGRDLGDATPSESPKELPFPKSEKRVVMEFLLNPKTGSTAAIPPVERPKGIELPLPFLVPDRMSDGSDMTDDEIEEEVEDDIFDIVAGSASVDKSKQVRRLTVQKERAMGRRADSSAGDSYISHEAEPRKLPDVPAISQEQLLLIERRRIEDERKRAAEAARTAALARYQDFSDDKRRGRKKRK